jgi:hypothetical protein
MIQIINKQIELIEEGRNWVISSLKNEKQKNAYRNLVNLRRKVNRKKYTLEENPAAAMYGESQMGKSYLVGGLLSQQGKPFSVVDGNGDAYDFINQINPIGKGTESTSLVTRFSTKYQWHKPEYPVKARLLSPTDIVLVLCDTYYNDIKAKFDTALSVDIINDKIAAFEAALNGRSSQQSIITEDDVLDIHEYFSANFSTKASNIQASSFFDKIPLLIAQTKSGDWKDIFSLLWNENVQLTNLFSKLISEYEKFGFVNTVYIPIEAVLRDFGTLLDVTRLHEIYKKHEGTEPSYNAETSVLYINSKNEEVEIQSFSKSYLCALAAELIFRLPNELENSKPFLNNTDLLDFPGARHRLGIHEEDIDDQVIPQMLLRGKVAYLFNKYSNSEKINILLFCHSNKQSAQSAMPEMLNRWIEEMVGKTPEARRDFINESIIPPLFVISTMFNIDLQFDFNNDKAGNRNYLDNRWERRFLKVLEKEIFGIETYSWLRNWTKSNPNFQNIYLLRDFFYSSDTESKIYEGYNEQKIEQREIMPDSYSDFRKDLRQSFMEYDFVKKHFENPVVSWDRAASINEDGTQLIIDKLTVAATNINTARRQKTIVELNTIAHEFVAELKKYYNDSDSNALLQKAKRTAGEIQLKLDITFGRDPYFFGKMMKEFMISEGEIYSLYRKKIYDIEKVETVNMEKYIAIRMNTPELDSDESAEGFERNLERLRTKYEKASKEQCQADFEAEGIDLTELFYGNKERMKNFSQILAEELELYWFEECLQSRNYKNLSAVFSEAAVLDMLDMLRTLYKKLQITAKITEKIRRYVDTFNDMEAAQAMIADSSAEIINRFINTIGNYYLSESEINDIKQANIKNNLGLILDHDDLKFENADKNEVALLFSKIDNLPELLKKNPIPIDAIKSLPIFSNYKQWYDLLKVGFVSVCDIPNYDIQANEKLGRIIGNGESVHY